MLPATPIYINANWMKPRVLCDALWLLFTFTTGDSFNVFVLYCLNFVAANASFHSLQRPDNCHITGNFSKFPLGKKKGKGCEINGISLDFYRNIPVWENATKPIPGTGRTQNIPNNGIFQTQLIPSNRILLGTLRCGTARL